MTMSSRAGKFVCIATMLQGDPYVTQGAASVALGCSKLIRSAAPSHHAVQQLHRQNNNTTSWHLRRFHRRFCVANTKTNLSTLSTTHLMFLLVINDTNKNNREENYYVCMQHSIIVVGNIVAMAATTTTTLSM
jgi:hypothetical protein